MEKVYGQVDEIKRLMDDFRSLIDWSVVGSNSFKALITERNESEDSQVAELLKTEVSSSVGLTNVSKINGGFSNDENERMVLCTDDSCKIEKFETEIQDFPMNESNSSIGKCFSKAEDMNNDGILYSSNELISSFDNMIHEFSKSDVDSVDKLDEKNIEKDLIKENNSITYDYENEETEVCDNNILLSKQDSSAIVNDIEFFSPVPKSLRNVNNESDNSIKLNLDLLDKAELIRSNSFQNIENKSLFKNDNNSLSEINNNISNEEEFKQNSGNFIKNMVDCNDDDDKSEIFMEDSDEDQSIIEEKKIDKKSNEKYRHDKKKVTLEIDLGSSDEENDSDLNNLIQKFSNFKKFE